MSFALVADIGGTHARFALIQESHELQSLEVLKCSDYAHINDAIADYLQRVALDSAELRAACLAIAGPVGGEQIDMLNNHWHFAPADVEKTLGAPLTIINDFTAQAMCVDSLGDDDLQWLGDARPSAPGIRVIMGPGTGLGVAASLPDGSILPSEGGHVGFSPCTAHQVALLQALWERFGRVSAERLLSGQGLENLFWANAKLQGREKRLQAADINALAQSGDATALQAVSDLLDILASTAGDMALAFWAEGGVYLTGGVLEKLQGFVDAEKFRQRFEDKGRLKNFCEGIPVAIISAEHPGLLGCAEALLSRRREVA